MVKFKLDLKATQEILDKITGQWAFLIQAELIRLFPVSFRNRFVVTREGADWIVGTNYNIAKFYDKGTKPHMIEPKIKRALAFKWPSAPTPPGPDGRHIFGRVRHPGTTGKHIIENLEKDKILLRRLLDQAVRNVVK